MKKKNAKPPPPPPLLDSRVRAFRRDLPDFAAFFLPVFFFARDAAAERFAALRAGAFFLDAFLVARAMVETGRPTYTRSDRMEAAREHLRSHFGPTERTETNLHDSALTCAPGAASALRK